MCPFLIYIYAIRHLTAKCNMDCKLKLNSCMNVCVSVLDTAVECTNTKPTYLIVFWRLLHSQSPNDVN